ncbi:E3 ubiquitin-protein ligase RLIM-like protein [Actinidia rufa]|uniref:E3 ubiquitin-protein ligase RLIM-like protein n=1 Tax=Actinidia rufa TaxID=165716 RepID=A0A7J0FWD7_9ERIC|nr:E3 ubiquitin-protein ligase RLIM-like protein [Actinidia rufa]
MNGDKKMGSSASSSFTSDLFGSNESSASSSSGILGSIFSPSSKVLGRESLRSEVVEKKQNSASQFWTMKSGAAQGTRREVVVH